MLIDILMIKRLPLLLLILRCSFTNAQTIKTDVLVVGGTASGVATAMQCARSKVKTVLAVEGESIVSLKGDAVVVVTTNRHIPSGIWGEFRKHVKDFYKSAPGYDTTLAAGLKFEPAEAADILKKMTDTVKNLTVYDNSPFTTIKKDGDKWEVSIIQNAKTIKIIARVVVDATENGDVVTKTNGQFEHAFNYSSNAGDSNNYRTSIATGEALPGLQRTEAGTSQNNYLPYPAFCIPMRTVLVKGDDNILVTEKALPGEKDVQCLPVQLALGQGVGTMAAFCGFFRTTTAHLHVRIIQGELLDFKGYLLPFSDITQKDADWRAVQQVCASGFLKGTLGGSRGDAQLLFRPDSLVNTAEVQPVLTEIYTRAFLWFAKEKPGEKFTLGNMLSFISDYNLTDPFVLKVRMQREWRYEYKFQTNFDVNRPITRREFAVLTNRYLNPFARTVDLNGRLVN